MANSLIIEGVDFSRFQPVQSVGWELNDLDSEDSGRETRDALMYRSVIARKVKLEITMNPMNEEEIKQLLSVLTGKTYLTATYIDPLAGSVTKTFYNSSRAATLRHIHSQKGPIWEGIKFSLIER